MLGVLPVKTRMKPTFGELESQCVSDFGVCVRFWGGVCQIVYHVKLLIYIVKSNVCHVCHLFLS